MSVTGERLPDPFSRYHLEEEWAGGEGRSLRIASPEGTEQILKILPPGQESAEADLLMSLRHPMIPRWRDHGRLETGEAYVLRDWVEGCPLHDCLPLDPMATLDLASQLLEILAYVHLRGLLHLDLKPGNVLRDSDGRFHLLDFGLGARKGARSRSGTPFFASPEQWSDGRVDRRSDLYALGMLLVASLDPGSIRRRPGGKATGWDLEELEQAGMVAPNLPKKLGTLLAGLVARRVRRRFHDAEEALAWLEPGSGRPSPSLLEPDPALHAAGKAMSVEGMSAHLSQALELPDDDARRLTTWIQAREIRLPEELESWLLDRVAEGRILPRGTAWSFPDAMAGREYLSEETGRIEDADQLQAVAASGRIEGAERAFRQLVERGLPERELRLGLAEGLIMAGEATRALPLLHDLPIQRLRALVDVGRIREAEEGLESLDETSLDEPGTLRLKAKIAWLAGKGDAARSMAERAGLEEPGPEAQIVLARILAETGEADRARGILEDVVAVLRERRQPFLLAGALSNLGDLLRNQGRLEDALAFHDEALDLYQTLGHVRYTALAQSNLGVVLKAMTRHEEALEAQRRALGLYRHVGDARGAAIAMANQGILHRELDQPRMALKHLEAARAALTELGAANLETRLQLEIAAALVACGELDRAEEKLEGLHPESGSMELFETVRSACQERRQMAIEESAISGGADERRGMAADREQDSPSGRAGIPREVFRTFVSINRKLANESDLDRALHAVLDSALTLSGARQGYLLLAGPTGIRSELRIGQGPGSNAFSRSIANRAIHEQRILEGSEALADRDLTEMPSVRRLEQRSVLCVPFQCASGQTGALYVEHPGRAGVFGEAEKEHLEVLADQAAIAVDRMLREEELSAELSRSRRDLDVARQALGVRRPRRELLGPSSSMEALRGEIQRLAPAALPVLIYGETGTGKELVAEALHRESRRGQGPFVSQNCAAIPTELAESLLFGHVKGAFTGADGDRPGLLELASGGTLFLDEIGELPLSLQAKLLRALQEGVIRRVGGEVEHGLDLRLISATHRDLEEDMASGRFREDLYYRIAAAVLLIPPLRDRGEDAIYLAEHFLHKLVTQEGEQSELSDQAREEIRAYAWPGNVRELEHRIARAFLMQEDGRIQGFGFARQQEETTAERTGPTNWPITTLKEVESRTIEAVLGHTGGDKTRAAKILGISRTALYEKLKRIKAGPTTE